MANYYKPTCATDCTTSTLPAFGDVCASEATVEMGEIQDLFIDDLGVAAGTAKNPITGWVSTGLSANDKVNEAVILTWFAAVSNTVASKTRWIEVTGDKSEPAGTSIELPKGVTIDINVKQTIKVSTNVMNNARYEAFRALQCKGKKRIWWATDKGFYGGLNGIEVNISKAYFTYGGKGNPKTFNLELEFYDSIDPPRDNKPFS